jgi:hypothetical protein
MVMLNPTSAAHKGLANNKKAKTNRAFFIILSPSKNIFFTPMQSPFPLWRHENYTPFPNQDIDEIFARLGRAAALDQISPNGSSMINGMPIRTPLAHLDTDPKIDKGLLLTPYLSGFSETLISANWLIRWPITKEEMILLGPVNQRPYFIFPVSFIHMEK